MFGKCPLCKVKLKQEELNKLKKREAARCFKCGKLYINTPKWVITKFVLMLILPIIVPPLKIKILTVAALVISFLIIALYHNLKPYMPLIEENML